MKTQSRILRINLLLMLASAALHGRTTDNADISIQHGVAVRRYLLHDICEVRLFTTRTLTYEEALSGSYSCRLQMKYLRSISKSDYRPGWIRSLVKTSDKQLTVSQAESYAMLLPEEVSKNSVLEIAWNPDWDVTVTYTHETNSTSTKSEDLMAFQSLINSMLGPLGPDGVSEIIWKKRPVRLIMKKAK